MYRYSIFILTVSSIMCTVHILIAFILTTGFQQSVSAGADNVQTTLAKWWTVFSTSHPKYQELTEILDEMQKLFPTLANKYSIGKSVKGSELWVINLAENVNKPRPLLRPMVKIVANIHGDETLGRALSLMLATKLLEGYNGKQARITKLLQNTDIHILISANPDGFEVSVEGDCKSLRKGKGRRNSNGVDLNRNFPDQFYPKKTPPPQVETTHLIKWITGHPFVLSASLHGGALVASYPFDSLSTDVILALDKYSNKGVPSLSPDNAVFLHLAQLYAKTHPTMGTQTGDQNHNFCEKNNFKETGGITNGADWYNVQGGMQDYNYVNSNCFEITFELSCCKYPKGTELLKEWGNNEEALLTFLESAQMGVKGVVTGVKVGAKIHVEGINHTVTVNERGEYWRLLVPGEYTISIEAEAPKKVTLPKIKVEDTKSPVILNHKFA